MSVITATDNQIKMTADEDAILERLDVSSIRFYPGSGGGAVAMETKIVTWDDRGRKTVLSSGQGVEVFTATIADGNPIDFIGEGIYMGLRITSLSGTGAYILVQCN